MMATISKQFDSYAIYYNTSSGVRIYCRSSGKPVGTLEFVEENKSIPKNRISASEEITIYFPITKFSDLINILRYEKPLFLQVYDSGMGSLATQSEPAGEQEP